MPSFQSRIMRLMLETTARFQRNMTYQQVRRQTARSPERLFLPKGVRIERVDANGVPAEWVIPANLRSDAVMMYIHGGGFVLGLLWPQRRLIAQLATLMGMRVFAPDYKLAPEHPFPVPMADCATAFRWLIEKGGVKPSKVVFMGESAGANLVVTTAIHLRDAGRKVPAGLIPISGVFDLAGSASFRTIADPMGSPAFVFPMLEAYRGTFSAHHPLISPICAELRGLPPMYIQAGGRELFRADSEVLAESVKVAGGNVTLDVFPEMWHFWHLCPMPEARQAIERIAQKTKEFVKE